jgi:hypothetical protein
MSEASPPRVLNKRVHGVPEGAVYVGRPTKWGNPFPISLKDDRDVVIARYRRWVCDQPSLLAALPDIRGKCLVCWCAPAACHADILLELANA